MNGMHLVAGDQAPSSEQLSVGWFIAGEGVSTPAETKVSDWEREP